MPYLDTVAAAQAFADGGSEYEIHLAHLQASAQHESELPYPNIVAMNEHAATLHYQKYDRALPTDVFNLLIDAGAKSQCYHADVTRSYVNGEIDEFAELIAAVDRVQQLVIAEIRVGQSFVELHERMAQLLAEVVYELDLVRLEPSVVFESELIDTFFPHGLGHLLGLQTHDVGGFITDENGTEVEPHQRYSSLRLDSHH